MHAYQSWMHKLHKTVTHSPFYSYKWKRGWNWPCVDTTLPPLIMLFLFKHFFYYNFYKKMKEVCIKTRATSASRTSEARVLSPQHCKMVYSEFRQKSHYLLCRIIVIRGDQSWKTTKTTAVYVGSSLKGHNLCFLLANCDGINFWDAFICHLGPVYMEVGDPR